MSSAIIVEKLDGNSVTSTSPSRNQPQHQYQLIDPLELESSVQQVKRDLNLARTEKREVPHTHISVFPATQQPDKDVKFVRHYATPRRVIPTKEERKTTWPLPQLLSFESESNLVLERLQNILLEKPTFSKTPKNVKFAKKIKNVDTSFQAQTSPFVPKNDSDWLGPASYLRKTQRVASPVSKSQKVDNSSSPRSQQSSPQVTSRTASSASPRVNDENLLFKTIQDALKKIDDEESSIARRLADVSFTSSSGTSNFSSIADPEPILPDMTIYRRPLKTTRDETCQTAGELVEDDQSVRSDPDLPSAAESILEQLEREGFYESLLQHELDLIT